MTLPLSTFRTELATERKISQICLTRQFYEENQYCKYNQSPLLVYTRIKENYVTIPIYVLPRPIDYSKLVDADNSDQISSSFNKMSHCTWVDKPQNFL